MNQQKIQAAEVVSISNGTRRDIDRDRRWQHGFAALLVSLLVGLVFATSAQAQAPARNQVETARGLAMGTGARASGRGVSSVAYNPAAMGMGEVYQIGSIVDFDVETGAWGFGGIAVDSVTSDKVAAGFSGRGVRGGGNDAFNGYDLRLALGLPLGEMFGIGATARFVRLRNGLQDEVAGDQNLKRFTMDVSLMFRPIESLSFAAFGYNLIDTDSTLAPRMVGGGIAFDYETTFSIGVDLLVDLSTYDDPAIIAGGGAEFLAGNIVPIRAGYEFNSGRDAHFISAGLGYVHEQAGIDLSMRRGVSNSRETRLVLGFQYHVQ